MNWLFGKSKSNLPEPTALQALKAKQIEQLKYVNQNVSEIHRDVEYRVNTVHNGNSLSLYITLPPTFPQDRPLVKVSPAVRHPWVNEQMLVVGCPGVNNFVTHSDLGKVIRSIVEEFQRVPPVFMSTPQHAQYLPYPVSGEPQRVPNPGVYQPYSQPAGGGSAYMPSVVMPTLPPTSMPPSTYPGATSNNIVQQPVVLHSSHCALPELPHHFPELNDLSLNELQKLNEDEDHLIEVLMCNSWFKQLHSQREDLCQKNQTLAEENLSKQPILEENKKSLLKKYECLHTAREQFESRASTQKELYRQFEPTTLQARLKLAALQSEEESEAIADNFITGNITVEEFTKKYMQVRKVAHTRKSKEEKLAQFVGQGF